MRQTDDLSKSITPFVQGNTLVAIIELSLSSWLVAGVVPGIARQPLKKLEPDEAELLRLLHRWRDEAVKSGCAIERVVVAYEAGRDGFWLARWLRGERGHCGMVAVPTIEEEDAKRPHRERENLVGEKTRIVNRMKAALIRLGIRGFKPELRRAPLKLDGLRTPEGLPIPPNTLDEIRRDLARLAMVREQIDLIEQARLERITQGPKTGPNAMVRLVASIVGVGVETADMLVREVLSRDLRDRRAVARYAGLTGSPDESGSKRREKGLARAGNARVRRGLIQLAWRFLGFQKDSALTQWYRARTDGVKGASKTKMIVALARKLLIALWRMVTTGEVPEGVRLRPVEA